MYILVYSQVYLYPLAIKFVTLTKSVYLYKLLLVFKFNYILRNNSLWDLFTTCYHWKYPFYLDKNFKLRQKSWRTPFLIFNTLYYFVKNMYTKTKLSVKTDYHGYNLKYHGFKQLQKNCSQQTNTAKHFHKFHNKPQ